MNKPVDFMTELIEKKNLTSDVLFLSFKIPASFTFKAGQYVMLKMELNGVVRWKSYSILNPPSKKGVIDLCVKIIEGGFASAVFVKLKKGDSLLMKGPIGLFVFDEFEQEHWFIGAGTGITPLYSMIMEYLPKFPQKKFKLIFGVRTKSTLLFHDEFEKLAREYNNFEYVPTLSQENWEGKIGRVQKHLGEDLQGKIFYVCGLKELVLETKELLVSKGVVPAKVRFERYN